MDQRDIIDPFKSKNPDEGGNSPSKRELWIVLAAIILLAAILLIQRL